MVDLNHAAVDGIKLSVNAPDDISDIFSLEKSPSIPKSQAENLISKLSDPWIIRLKISRCWGA